jgi:two-component system sensor histidine kinase ResE
VRSARLGLTGRLLIGGALVAVLFVGQLVLTTVALHSIHHHTDKEQRSEQAIISAERIERLVLDVSSGTRGYVISGDPSFLTAAKSAARQLPAESARLKALAPGPASDRIDRAWRTYLREWSIPLVTQVATDPQAARKRVSSLEGLRRIAGIRAKIDGFVNGQNAMLASDRHEITRAERRADVLEVGGAVVRILLFALIILYLLRAIVWPLRRISAATMEVAQGRIDVEVPEEGPGEVGELARSFNEMSRSLQRNRGILEEQNDDLERLATVLRAVLDSTLDGILLSDSDGNFQLANRPMVNLTRDLEMSFDGPVVDRLLSVEARIRDRPRYRAAMERLRDNPNESTFDEFEDSVSGRVFQGYTSPVRDDRGHFIGRVWMLREVTQQRELDRLKDEFVATVSHELRTPLTSMMGFLEMIREEEAGQLTDDQKRFLAIVYRSSERLQRLVGDLLFVARLDAAGLQLHYAAVEIDDVVRECVESVGALARSREIELELELGGVPAVWADRERLAQLVSNLVSNAIKFTPAGGSVTTRTFVEADEVAIQVEDTGIGIPKLEQDRLFQRFFRSSTATQQAIPGTGLGLVISKAIAEAHRGRIEVRSEAGEGTTFTVRLPCDPEEAAA